jgi:hypothetical protein
MSKPAILLIAAIMPLTAGACSATDSGAQFATAARPADAAYCQSLVNLYTTYAGTVGGSLGGNTRGGEPADLDAKVATAQPRGQSWTGDSRARAEAARQSCCRAATPLTHNQIMMTQIGHAPRVGK